MELKVWYLESGDQVDEITLLNFADKEALILQMKAIQREGLMIDYGTLEAGAVGGDAVFGPSTAMRELFTGLVGIPPHRILKFEGV